MSGYQESFSSFQPGSPEFEMQDYRQTYGYEPAPRHQASQDAGAERESRRVQHQSSRSPQRSRRESSQHSATDPGSFSRLGRRYLTPDDPPIAVQLNENGEVEFVPLPGFKVEMGLSGLQCPEYRRMSQDPCGKCLPRDRVAFHYSEDCKEGPDESLKSDNRARPALDSGKLLLPKFGHNDGSFRGKHLRNLEKCGDRNKHHMGLWLKKFFLIICRWELSEEAVKDGLTFNLEGDPMWFVYDNYYDKSLEWIVEGLIRTFDKSLSKTNDMKQGSEDITGTEHFLNRMKWVFLQVEDCSLSGNGVPRGNMSEYVEGEGIEQVCEQAGHLERANKNWGRKKDPPRNVIHLRLPVACGKSKAEDEPMSWGINRTMPRGSLGLRGHNYLPPFDGDIFFHYTSLEGVLGILESNCIRASTEYGIDAFHGPGVYGTKMDIHGK